MGDYGNLSLSERELVDIRDTASDWALTHGLVVRPRWGSGERGVGVAGPHTLFPSLVPARLLRQGCSSWPSFARILHRAASHPTFLQTALASVVEADDFTRRLWNVYTAVQEEGVAQPLYLCLCRNDFMMCLGNDDILSTQSSGSDAEVNHNTDVTFADENSVAENDRLSSPSVINNNNNNTNKHSNNNDTIITSKETRLNNKNSSSSHSELPPMKLPADDVTMTSPLNGDDVAMTSLLNGRGDTMTSLLNGDDDFRVTTTPCREGGCWRERRRCCSDKKDCSETEAEAGLQAAARPRLQLPASVKALFDTAVLKQIEINPFAAGTAGVCSQLVSLHRLTLRLAGISYQDDQMPYNNPVFEMSKAVVHAWRLYGNSGAVVLMVVSHADPYTLDQRLLEFHAYDLDPHIKVIRRTFLEVEERATLAEDRKLWMDNQEVALVYYRRGYGPACYPTEKEWSARLLLERSAAVKCPPISVQLMGTKKVQQELCRPGTLEKFLEDQEEVEAVRSTFAKLYSLDLSPEGDAAAEMALADPSNFVLKHQRDGGGFNLFGEEVRDFLASEECRGERPALVLMERLRPAWQPNFLAKRPAPPPGLRPSAVTFTPDPQDDVITREGPPTPQPINAVSEIGVYGAYIRRGDEELYTAVCGTMLRTKPLGEDAAGFTVGIAVYDTPLLVD